MSQSTLSRRISEFVGVALFALALIWLISLVTYDPTDPGWVFTTGAGHAPAEKSARPRKKRWYFIDGGSGKIRCVRPAERRVSHSSFLI